MNLKKILAALERGEHVQIRPHGGSMRGRIESGQLVTISPATIEEVEEGDVVFVSWKGNFLLHLVKERTADRVLIGNNIGKTNGWAAAIVGKVVDISD